MKTIVSLNVRRRRKMKDERSAVYVITQDELPPLRSKVADD